MRMVRAEQHVLQHGHVRIDAEVLERARDAERDDLRAPVRGRCARPANEIAPLATVYSRVTQLNSVVLPAPFGPISPQISPSLTAQVTPSSARTPPKRTDTSSMRSNGLRVAHFVLPACRARDSARDLFVASLFPASRRAVQRESDCRHCARRTLHFIQVAACGRGARLRRSHSRIVVRSWASQCMPRRDPARVGGACPMPDAARSVPESRAKQRGRPNCRERKHPWHACRIRSWKTCRRPSGRSTSA